MKKIVTKHNDLIDNYIFNATESELQILNYAVASTNTLWDNQNLVYRIDIPELSRIYNTKSKNNYKLYRDALNRLMKREISFYRGNKKHTQNIIIEYIEDMDDSSYLVFKFNTYVSLRLSKLKGFFTQYNIQQIANFKSKYAFMLYDIFKMKLGQLTNNKAYKQTVTVKQFKENLDISSKYNRFYDLEKIVLTPAKENINKHSDIQIGYTVKRKGRTPIAIVFTAKYKTKRKIIEETKQEQAKINNVSKDKPTIKKATVEPERPLTLEQRKQKLAELKKIK